MKEAGRWRRDDPGLRAEEQRLVVRRMNSDWRSAQWQLNDLRSVDSVSINQTALSRSPFFFSSSLGSNFFLCLRAERRCFVPTLSISFVFCFSISACGFPSPDYRLLFLSAPWQLPQQDSFHFFFSSALVREWKNEAILLSSSIFLWVRQKPSLLQDSEN